MHDLLSYPAEIRIAEADIGHVIITVGIETRRDKNHFWLELLQCRHPMITYRGPEFVTFSGCIEGDGDNTFSVLRWSCEGEKRVLKDRAVKHPVITYKDVFGAIALVDVKIEDGNLFQTVLFKCMGRSDSQVVKQAEAQRAIAFGMVAGRPDTTKGIIHIFIHQQVDGGHN